MVNQNIRGIEDNTLTGCKSILDMAQDNQLDEMRQQIAVVDQMIQLRKTAAHKKLRLFFWDGRYFCRKYP